MLSNIYKTLEIAHRLCLEVEGRMVRRTEVTLMTHALVGVPPPRALRAKVLKAQ